MGELGEAERCFAREQELGATTDTSFDLALAAFAAGQDAAARRHAERMVAAAPDHTGARLVAAFLADRGGAPELARAHLLVVVRVIERRRAGVITPLEPSLDELVQTGRHIELLDWYREVLEAMDHDDTAAVRGAAAHLVLWADHLVTWASQERELPPDRRSLAGEQGILLQRSDPAAWMSLARRLHGAARVLAKTSHAGPA